MKKIQKQYLINMKKLRVQVIIPDPVIVEPPYILSMGLHDDDLLKLEGLKIKNSTVKLETIFSGINGYILKLITKHLI